MPGDEFAGGPHVGRNDPDTPDGDLLASLSARVAALEATPSGASGPTLMAVYKDNNSGQSPALVLDSNFPDDADGDVCEVNSNGNELDILRDCVASITFHGEVFGAGLTGGTVSLTVGFGGLGGATLLVDDSGQAETTNEEFDGTVTLANIPLSAGDQISASLGANGIPVAESVARLVITAI